MYDDEAPSYNTVAKWFNKNCEELEHETCLARSVTETSSANIDEVRCLVGDDSRLMIDKIEVETGMISDTIE